eukprot:CAMPEP_0183448348 /NCGR_PEP_ID=MMETSP0370-20130417/105968_1 /TAXON_ID=268820 /ORGANISM="Peridinium aciculiferum, Strain PAER-2" /LENGTH=57 /DNA_ID=CAMNT_0025639301 /DNA_START=61 /DNA_END=231 /DNA_ORIENTATION=-
MINCPTVSPPKTSSTPFFAGARTASPLAAMLVAAPIVTSPRSLDGLSASTLSSITAG